MEEGSKGSWDFQETGWLGEAVREVSPEFHEGPGEHGQLCSIHHSLHTWHFSERQQIIAHASSHKESTRSDQECLSLQSYHSTVLFRVSLEISTPTLPQDTQKSSACGSREAQLSCRSVGSLSLSLLCWKETGRGQRPGSQMWET